MPFKNQISVMMKRFGQPTEVLISTDNGTQTYSVSAFIQSLIYKNKIYLETQATNLGLADEGRYLYIGPSEPKLDRLGEGVIIKSAGTNFSVSRAEEVCVGGTALYCWAILNPRMVDGKAESYE